MLCKQVQFAVITALFYVMAVAVHPESSVKLHGSFAEYSLSFPGDFLNSTTDTFLFRGYFQGDRTGFEFSTVKASGGPKQKSLEIPKETDFATFAGAYEFEEPQTDPFNVTVFVRDIFGSAFPTGAKLRLYGAFQEGTNPIQDSFALTVTS